MLIIPTLSILVHCAQIHIRIFKFTALWGMDLWWAWNAVMMDADARGTEYDIPTLNGKLEDADMDLCAMNEN